MQQLHILAVVSDIFTKVFIKPFITWLRKLLRCDWPRAGQFIENFWFALRCKLTRALSWLPRSYNKWLIVWKLKQLRIYTTCDIWKILSNCTFLKPSAILREFSSITIRLAMPIHSFNLASLNAYVKFFSRDVFNFPETNSISWIRSWNLEMLGKCVILNLSHLSQG